MDNVTRIPLSWLSAVNWLFVLLSGLFGYILRGIFDQLRQREDTRWAEKRNLAKEAIAMLDKGQSSGYENKLTSSDLDQINKLTSLTYTHDKDFSESFNKFSGLWQMFSIMDPNRFKIPPHQYNELIEDLRQRRTALDSITNKLRKKAQSWL